MKRFASLVLIALILVAALLSLSSPGKASAHVTIPHIMSCQTGCESWGEWNGGTTYGMYTQYQVSNPDTSQCQVCNYARSSVVNLQGNDTTSSIVVGLMKQNGLNGWCGMANNNKLYYFVDAFGSGGIGNQIYLHCAGVPSADIGNNVAWKIAPYVSNGGGMLVQLFSSTYAGNVNGTSAFFISYAKGVPHSFTRIKYDEFFFGQPFTPSNSHWVAGVDWANNQWVQGAGNLVYHSTSFTATSFYGRPVFMYWDVPPEISNTGGDLFSCIYDAPSGCVFGS